MGNKDQEMRQMFLQAEEPELKKQTNKHNLDSNFEKRLKGKT